MKKFMHRIATWFVLFAMFGSLLGHLGKTKAQAAAYPGDYQEGYTITLAELAAFEGDVTIAVEFELMDGYEYSQLAFFSRIENWPKLHENSFVNLSYPTYDGYWFNQLRGMNENTMVFTLKESAVKQLIAEKGGLGIQVYGVSITKVTLGGDASVNPNAGYVGDWGAGKTIPASEFAKFTGDVTFTLKYREVVGGYDWFQVKYVDMGIGWADLSRSDFVKMNHVFNDYGCFELVPGEKEITVTLSKDAVKRIVENGGGLGVVVYGVIIEGVELSGGTPTPTPKPTTKPTPTLKPGQTPKPTATPKPTKKPTATPTPTPIVYKKADKLVLTKDMVGGDGTLNVKYYDVKTIYIPRDTGAKRITLNNVNADKVLVESGITYELTFAAGNIKELVVVPAQVNGIEGTISTPATNPTADEYALYLKTLNEKPTITTGKNANIASVVVKGNAELQLKNGKTEKVNVDTTESYLLLFVEVDGYRGSISVTNREEKKENCTLFVDLGDSRVSNFEVTGGGVCRIDGRNASVETLQADGIAGMTVSVDTKNVVVEGNTSDSKVKIYSEVENLQVAGTDNDIVLANSAVVDNAKVTGNGAKIYGYGRLNDAEVTGEGAVIATPNTDVEGDYDRKAPAEMENMKPNTMEGVYEELQEQTGNKEPEEPTVITLSLDAAYPGDYQCGTNIPASVLNQFKGDVAITLDYVLTGTAEWPQFACVLAWTENWPKVMVSSAGDNGFTNLPSGKTSITFVLSKEDVWNVVTQNEGGGELGFQVSGAYFKKAVLRDAKKSDFYVGDYQPGYSFKNAEVKELYGDVTLTVNYTVLNGFADPFFQLTDLSDWSDLSENDLIDFSYEMREDGKSILAPAGAKSITLKIKAEAMEKIANNGNSFAVRVYGIVIDSATLVGEERPEPTPTPEPAPEPVRTPAYTGSVSFVADGGWVENEVSKEQLLGGVKASDVEYIVFSSPVNFAVGYAATDADWAQEQTANTYTISNINWNYFAMKLTHFVNDGAEHPITWEVYKNPKYENLANTGSVTIAGEAWNAVPIAISDLLGDVAAEDVAFLRITASDYCWIGYASSVTGDWAEQTGALSFETEEIRLDEYYNLQVGGNPGIVYTWEVFTK